MQAVKRIGIAILLLSLSLKGLWAFDGPRGAVDLRFEEADVVEVVRAVVEGYLGRNLVIEPGVGGKVTLSVRGAFSQEELFKVLEDSLAFFGLRLVDRGQYVLLTRVERVPEFVPSVLTQGMADKALVVQKVSYIPLEDAKRLLEPFLSKGAFIRDYKGASALLIIDRAPNLETAFSILRAFDQPFFKDIVIEAVPLKEADPEWVTKEVERLMDRLAPLKENKRLKEEVVLLPLKQVGKIMAFSTKREFIEFVKQLIASLDVSGAGSEQRIWIRFVENGDAEHIAGLLSQIFTGRVQQPPKQQQVVAPEKGVQQPQPSLSATAMVSGPIDIIADKANNALIIKATPQDYRAIEEVISRLDVKPRQVFIEATILEVTLKGDLSYGVEWFLKKNLFTFGQRFGSLPSGEIPFGGGPLTIFGYYLEPGEFTAFVELLSTKTDVKILSNPTVIATDNQPARIVVGGKVPTLTQTLTTVEATERVVSSVQYQTYGIILSVTPHISSAGTVRLQVKQEYTDVQQETFAGLSTPSFIERSVESNLVARDGQTVLLGGLIQNKQSQVKKGLPLLKDIPLLGFFLGHSQRVTERTELIIAITPRVAKEEPEAVIGREFVEKMKKLKKLLPESMKEKKEKDTQGTQDQRPFLPGYLGPEPLP